MVYLKTVANWIYGFSIKKPHILGKTTGGNRIYSSSVKLRNSVQSDGRRPDLFMKEILCSKLSANCILPPGI